ncbi:MAG: hypothetical protein ABXS91_01590 [Sulfurimonas sp.]
MKKDSHPVSKLRKYIKKHGTKILLPQNLPDEILNRLVQEVKALDDDRPEEVPSSTLLMCILFLKNGPKMTDSMKIEFSEEEILDYFNMYTIYIRLEDMRRKGLVHIPDDSLPTLQNIFDKSRKMDIMGLD